MLGPEALDSITGELAGLRRSGRQTRPFSERYPNFGLEDAYDIAIRIRDLRLGAGEHVVGRKIGFTNREIWRSQGLAAPIWNYMFDRSVADVGVSDAVVDLSGFPEPRIEPEVVIHLCDTPSPAMGERDLAACIDWIAPGFEVVYSVFPDWNFAASDAAAAYGVHAALFVGEHLNVAPLRETLASDLADTRVTLASDAGERREGRGRDVLGGPLAALGFLVAELSRRSLDPLQAGEIVTTGTLTEALPLAPGQSWSAHFEGVDFRPVNLRTVGTASVAAQP